MTINKVLPEEIRGNCRVHVEVVNMKAILYYTYISVST